MVFKEEFFAFQNQLTVAVPHAEAHEAVEQVFQAHMLVVAVQVIVGPPQETPQVDFLRRVEVALFQESFVVINEGQLAFVVGEADAKEAPSVPGIDLGFRLFESNQRFDRLFNPKNMTA